MMRISNMLVAGLLLAGAQGAAAKGLDALSQNNPENAPPEEAKSAGKSGGGSGEAGDKPEAPMVKSESSKMIAGNMFMSASFGFVRASRSEGTWRTSGLGDVLIGYKLLPLSPQMSVAGTYRYAPIAMSGELDGRSYRGVWESHNVGGQLNYVLKESMTAVGSAELGYVAAHVHSLDGVKAKADAEKGGAVVTLGGGGDLAIGEKNTSSIGPRLRVGFGSFTTVQLSGAFNFLF